MAGFTKIISQTPTISTGAYTAKDAVGGKLTFAVEGRGSGVIHTVTVVDDAAQSAELVLVLFNQSFTATADNAAFDPSDADLENCIGKVKILATDYQALNDNAVASVLAVGLPYQTKAGLSLYGQLMCTGTPTYASTGDLTIKLHVLGD